MFEQYDLPESVENALRERKITSPTPVQSATLPHALAGGDVLGQARTGTGKTLAFAIPIARRLAADRSRGRPPRALVLTPTRELALQVAGELAWLARHLDITTVYGGTGYGSQAAELNRGTDVVVATPGRALDYLGRGILDLSAVEIAVLDEADEMLSMGFEEDVEKLLGATPPERQTLLFSATLPDWARRLSERHLRDPLKVNVVREEAVGYHELAIESSLGSRQSVLADVLHAHGGARSIVFANTKAETDKLAQALTQSGIPAESIHGDLNQAQRERAVERLRSGQVKVLVGTDVAARGLDIPEVDLVVHYRLPNDPGSYQHRSGRTGRAGRSGKVVIFHGPRERSALTRLERAVGRRFEHVPPPRPEEVQDAKLESLLARIEEQPAADRETWQGVAQRWLAQGNEQAIAGLLAITLGGKPAPRSLLTGEEGWVTLAVRGRVVRTPQVVRFLMESGAKDVGRIVEVGKAGALADVRPADEERLVGVENAGLTVERATSVPRHATDGGGRSGKPRSGRRREGRSSRTGGSGR
ncbi:MAG TPA: DEAD/DEAH box helicase [Trueperaceae bacterium]